jgi:hypothetical protein
MAKRSVKSRRVKLSNDNAGTLSTPVGLSNLAEGGQDAEKHNYNEKKDKRLQKVFSLNAIKGSGSPNRGKPTFGGKGLKK